MNILFKYFYRDAGNHKNWGEIIFQNDSGMAAKLLEEKFRAHLIDGEFFIAEEIGLPPLYFMNFDPELDHGWHEFSCLEDSNDKITDQNYPGIASTLELLQTSKSQFSSL